MKQKKGGLYFKDMVKFVVLNRDEKDKYIWDVTIFLDLLYSITLLENFNVILKVLGWYQLVKWKNPVFIPLG